MEILIFIVIWLAFGVLGAMIMSGKDRTGCGGFALGVLLGPIGLIIALLIRPSEKNEAQRQLRIDELKGSSQPSREIPRAKHPPPSPPQVTSQPPPDTTARPEGASIPSVFIRERSLRTGGVRYRWECDSCGEAGEWTESEANAESLAEAHVCARRIPRRR